MIKLVQTEAEEYPEEEFTLGDAAILMAVVLIAIISTITF
jgi:hypothetical protein